MSTILEQKLTPCLIFEKNDNLYNCISANQAASILGCNREIPDSSIECYFEINHAILLKRFFERAITDKEPCKLEGSFVTKAGKTVSGLVITPLMGTDKEKMHIVMTIEEVSISKEIGVEKTEIAINKNVNYTDELTRLKNELKKSSERYRSLFMYHPDAIFEFNKEGIFTNANQALEKVTGYKIKELLNKSFLPLMAEDAVEHAVEQFQQVLTGTPVSHESTIINKYGKRVDLSVISIPMIVDEEIVGLFGIAKDITEQKKLKQSYEWITEHTMDLIAVFDKNGIVEYASPSYEVVLGVKPEDYIGESGLVLIQQKTIRETRFNEGLGCVHCGSVKVKRNGKYRSRQRYLCRDCGKSFNDLTNTPIYHKRLKDWM